MDESQDKGSFKADIPTDAVEDALRSVERVTGHAAEGEVPVAVDPAEPAGGGIESLQAQLELSQSLGRETQKKLEEVHDRWVRAVADLENYRKRAQRERDELVARASQTLIRDLLPVLDSFDGALEAVATAGDDRLITGIRSTHQLLMDILAREGVEAIPAAGLAFDPTLHEAVSGGGSGDLVVTAEMRRGYSLGGRVLRPSLVAVATEDLDSGDSG